MIAGIDFSTRAVDVVLLSEDNGAARWYSFPLEGHDAFERARNVRDAMPHTILDPANGDGWDDVLACGIEAPFGPNRNTLLRIQGAILACIPRATLVQPFPPSHWRKTIGLPGNCSKEEVADRVNVARMRAMQPGPTWPQDACDAYCIALATRIQIQMVDVA